MYLIDTDVLSHLRRRQREPNIVAWISAQRSSDLYLSAITIGEIERGIERQRGKDKTFAQDLGVWLDRVMALYGDRILRFDVETARCWGRLSARIGNNNADLMIAATALEHGLYVVTRNTRHFTPCGVQAFDPAQPETWP